MCTLKHHSSIRLCIMIWQNRRIHCPHVCANASMDILIFNYVSEFSIIIIGRLTFMLNQQLIENVDWNIYEIAYNTYILHHIDAMGCFVLFHLLCNFTYITLSNANCFSVQLWCGEENSSLFYTITSRISYSWSDSVIYYLLSKMIFSFASHKS